MLNSSSQEFVSEDRRTIWANTIAAYSVSLCLAASTRCGKVWGGLLTSFHSIRGLRLTQSTPFSMRTMIDLPTTICQACLMRKLLSAAGISKVHTQPTTLHEY